MKPKKSQKANLEKSRFIYFQIGIIISLSFALFAFEFGSEERYKGYEDVFTAQIFQENDIIVTARKEEKTKKIEIVTIINEVDDENLVIDDPDFSYTEIDPVDFFDPDLFSRAPEIFNDEPDFITAEEMPLFNGGNPDIEFTKYISKHLRYPEIAKENGVMGRVILTFVINKQGLIENISVFHSAHPDLDMAAMSVVMSSPAWTPGKQNGKPVRIRYYFPVTFKLN
ncbi:MAG: energy transducer TonB [Bacteroidales bacterium]|nr:energy transducer TonB [Bacteroidales bacterium]MCF8389055.1 energy transducer TonB [Bacteroidales bacterium]